MKFYKKAKNNPKNKIIMQTKEKRCVIMKVFLRKKQRGYTLYEDTIDKF